MAKHGWGVDDTVEKGSRLTHVARTRLTQRAGIPPYTQVAGRARLVRDLPPYDRPEVGTLRDRAGGAAQCVLLRDGGADAADGPGAVDPPAVGQEGRGRGLNSSGYRWAHGRALSVSLVTAAPSTAQKPNGAVRL